MIQIILSFEQVFYNFAADKLYLGSIFQNNHTYLCPFTLIEYFLNKQLIGIPLKRIFPHYLSILIYINQFKT